MDENGYRGRFAPTPSGPLHLGSLLTALAGFLQARHCGGVWLLRIDDLDTQRSRKDAADTILHQLETHGLYWDESVRWQSQCVAEYDAAFDLLKRQSRLYRCDCSRARLAIESFAGPDGAVYCGRCRQRDDVTTGTMRIQVGAGTLRLNDPWQGSIKRDLTADVGDFVLRRADDQIGYQLACVIDEAAQRVTEVVRGSDLIGSSLRQLHLQQMMALTSPIYRHLPVLLDEFGRKLSKQNHAAPLNAETASGNLHRCLQLLYQHPPDDLIRSPVNGIIDWSIAHWRPAAIPSIRAFAAPN